MDQNSAQIDKPVIQAETILQQKPVKSKKRKIVLMTIGMLFSLFLLTALSLFIYNKLLESRIIIPDQSVSLTIHIDKLVLKKNSFLAISVPSSTQSQFLSLQYFKAGEYQNFDIPYASDSIEFDAQNTQTARAYIYEDSNLNEELDKSTDKTLTTLFNRPVFKKFNITKSTAPVLSCSQGFNEDFSGVQIDTNRWQESTGNKLENDGLIQSSNTSTMANQEATILYTQQKFSGDLLINTDILDFQSPDEGPTTVEITLFTEKDRVLNVSLNKTALESYLTYALSKKSDPLPDKEVITQSFPLNILLERKGTVGKIFLSGKMLWEIPNISTEDVYLGIETYNRSQNASEVSSSFDNISVSCPN